ncbi:MAG: hypothetical protein ACI4RO_04465, partial [Candidatus Scatosoma sp.]
MKIVFVSNYYNHHQAPLSEAFYKQTSGEYAFIATGRMSLERRKLGWGEKLPSFVLESYKDEITYQSVVDKLREKNEQRLKERRKKLEEEIREIGWFFTGDLTIFGIDFKQLNYKIKKTIGIGLLIL